MKKFLCLLVLFSLLLFFISFPQETIEASKSGLMLWFTQILPTLLPFCMLSYMVLRSEILPQKLGAGYVIFCGFLFGFPIGSKLTADFYKKKWISRTEADILCCFTNNLSPAFVIASLQQILTLSAPVHCYFLLYGIPLCYGIIRLLLYHRNDVFTQKETASRFHMDMQIVDAGIINGFETLIRICGYMILFSVFCAIFKKIPGLSPLFLLLLTGSLEVTNGMAALAVFPCSRTIRLFLALCFLSWGGICGLFQTFSILGDAGLSVKKYLAQKIVLLFLTITGSLLLLFWGVLL